MTKKCPSYAFARSQDEILLSSALGRARHTRTCVSESISVHNVGGVAGPFNVFFYFSGKYSRGNSGLTAP